jgi:DNA-binding PadR family transcriptional regulator
MSSTDPVERFPLSLPVFQVLLSLCEGPMHGYALLTDIKARTDTTVELGAGTLYAAIKRMAGAGLIEACDPPPGEVVSDSRRRYYRITEKGREVARTEALRIQALAALASDRRLLSDVIPAPTSG